MSDRDHRRIEAVERAPRREGPHQRMHAEPVARPGEEGAGRAQRLRADQQAPVGKPEQRLMPARTVDHRPLLDPLHLHTVATEGNGHQARHAEAGGDLGRVALMAIEQRDDAQHRADPGQRGIEAGDVDRVGDQAAAGDSDRARAASHRVAGSREPHERAAIVQGQRLDRSAGHRVDSTYRPR